MMARHRYLPLQSLQTAVFLIVVIHVGAHAEVCRFGSQPHCEFPCRCASGQCNKDTGACIGDPKGCAHGLPNGPVQFNWGGEACQIGNVAYGKVANQTGVLGLHSADKAIDGHLYDYEELTKYCACPYNSHGTLASPAEWQVDLGADHVIFNVTVFNTHDAYYTRMANFSLHIINSHGHELACASYEGTVEPGSHVTLSCSGTGRYVKFKRDSGLDTYRVVLCEVAVVGFRAVDCSRCPATSKCSQVTGCPACEGAKLPDCFKDCDWGTWGINCGETCGHCADNVTCIARGGTCPRGCQQGYSGAKCQTWTGVISTGTTPPTVPAVPDHLCTAPVIPWALFGIAFFMAVVFAVLLLIECRRYRSGPRRPLTDEMETSSLSRRSSASVRMSNGGVTLSPFKF